MQLKVFLNRALKKYRVPGASLAVMRNDVLVLEAQAGIVNIDSRLKVTRDAVFQIGSITKPMTATLVMQLVEEGLVSLDDRLDNYLPGWNRSSATIRQILSHSSGVEGDFFIDTGLGDDAIRRYVDKCTMVPSLFPPGELMSYCNLGYAVLGRLLEVVRGKPFDAIMQSYLFDPLCMNHAFVNPNQSIRFNCAVGHIPNAQGSWDVPTSPYLPFNQVAAGSYASMSAANLAQFAQLHLNKGVAADGRKILSRSTVRKMQHREIDVSKHARLGINGWGLGWSLMNWGDQRVYGHTGALVGQFSFLVILPGQNLSVSLLTNGGGYGAWSLFEQAFEKFILPFSKVGPPMLPTVNFSPADLDVYAGDYECEWAIVKLRERSGGLFMQVHDKASDKPSSPSMHLGFIDKNTARVNTSDADENREVLSFSKWGKLNKPEYLQIDLRQLRRS